MSTYYTLVNLTKKEQVCFTHLPAVKWKEIAGNPAASAIVAWYLLANSGDQIAFFGDETESPFPNVSYRDIADFPDRTDEMVETLIKEGILKDCGYLWRDSDDPKLYTRDLRNAILPAHLLVPGMKAPKDPWQDD